MNDADRSDVRAMLELAAEMAPKLRAAGVAMVRAGELEINLSIDAPATFVQAPAGEAAPDPERDPRHHRPDKPPLFRDPVTWGLPEGSAVPGYRRDGDQE
jgi:hypothetical protein